MLKFTLTSVPIGTNVNSLVKELASRYDEIVSLDCTVRGPKRPSCCLYLHHPISPPATQHEESRLKKPLPSDFNIRNHKTADRSFERIEFEVVSSMQAKSKVTIRRESRRADWLTQPGWMIRSLWLFRVWPEPLDHSQRLGRL